MKNLFKIIPILLISLTTFQSCNNNDDDNVEDVSTIVNLAVDSADLTSLVAALDRANLVSALNGEGPFTVLAPTNDAFAAFLSANNFNSLEDVPVDILTKVLLNHVISGSLISTDLSTGYANTLATSAASQTPLSIYVDTSNGVRFNGVSSVSAADILAVNGVIHKVDAVIGLPNIVTFATADPNFSTLVSALTRSDLTTDFVGVLSTDSATAPAPFTVFAPINDAFNRLLIELDLASLSEIDEPTLDVVLKYHVVGGANVLDSNLTDNLTVSTLSGDITADITGGARLTDPTGRVSDIIATNVQANNGVIHAINKVILP
jgi:transforming growth factor-beta-induced protein